ncbi:MAG: molecular chaperone HtpG [Microscillaceae bacterium]|jgi:molecular chaperone HtpG|nr:molecular chaperone HtpG [Microscillaceae bacterium]
MQEKGTISVNTENIFPIIKKFLYSDHEIFLRELVSNAVDACQKIKRLAALGEYGGELGDLKVKVSLNPEAKTITISDNGIGMTAEEIKKYINQVAFSGASEFLEKYKDKVERKEIIGNFGLGFYSAFMVSKQVQIVTLSHQENAEAALWTCDGSTEFSIESTVKQARGTDIVLHIAEDSEEFLDKYRLSSILTKYAKFLPITVELEDEVINETEPIWTKSPNDLKDEDYLNFYKNLYPMAEDPLFWIHLNVDYPFNLTGVLYFPKIKSNLELYKEKIQLYSRQVFITDEVKDIVPEFLMLLHGVIDSPDIPLNVSRSFLQADSNVKKINGYITKKVAEKLNELFKENRTEFEKKWESLGLFVKYGFVSDDKFYEKAVAFTLLQNLDNKHFTLDEYREHIQALQTDKDNKAVFLYTSDVDKQNTYIQSAKKKGYDVLKLDDRLIDSHFISALESKLPNTQLKRVDADTVDKLIDSGIKAESVLSEAESTRIKDLFEKILDNKTLTITVESLPQDEMPVVITLPEFMRRMRDMAMNGGMASFMANMPPQLNLAINGNHALTQKILQADEATQIQLIRQSYDLALLSQNMLGGENLTKFIERSVSLL